MKIQPLAVITSTFFITGRPAIAGNDTSAQFKMIDNHHTMGSMMDRMKGMDSNGDGMLSKD